ncbi:hypothetical protein OIE63_40575 (plasmid) [Streptomyces sp. NBC_01795]|uniref:hypothetical protein n=1 Tax=Streptomyces sp. NBC_01795 TaxID=2975943 RepID=UPI002DD962DE|nr:hypothetical protein [Streptomyces sp. NBC_01795]WSA97785.1 hypothetical protein OIE63_40575 [Streptomyces sp. NBC_01795]
MDETRMDETSYTAPTGDRPLTPEEQRQAGLAWSRLGVLTMAEESGISPEAVAYSLRFFALGWAARGRFADGENLGPAIAVEEVDQDLKLLAKVSAVPVGTRVIYHGSLARHGGIYRVQTVTGPPEERRYRIGRLDTWGQPKFLNGVHRSSLTPLSCFEDIAGFAV